MMVNWVVEVGKVGSGVMNFLDILKIFVIIRHTSINCVSYIYLLYLLIIIEMKNENKVDSTKRRKAGRKVFKKRKFRGGNKKVSAAKNLLSVTVDESCVDESCVDDTPLLPSFSKKN